MRKHKPKTRKGQMRRFVVTVVEGCVVGAVCFFVLWFVCSGFQVFFEQLGLA